ncbi:hypothetical protein GGR58DRAFT_511502 [Xylaria digitata]|nr:hypothetical protein GGR58DRAFT_511502 [Xylaria digitata]
MAQSPSPLATKLLNIRDYSDLIIECDDGQKFRVHRAIVCGQSSVVAAALNGPFTEAQTGVLHVSFDFQSVRRLIEFMYEGDYQVSHNPDIDILSSGVSDGTLIKQLEDMRIIDEGTDPAKLDPDVGALELSEIISGRLICHARMNCIADYYDVPALAGLSTTKVQNILVNEWSAKSFCYLLQESLGSTRDKNFHRMLGEEAANHIHELFDNDIFDEGGPAEGIAAYVLPKCQQHRL